MTFFTKYSGVAVLPLIKKPLREIEKNNLIRLI